MTDTHFPYKTIQDITLNKSNMLKYTQYLTQTIPKVQSIKSSNKKPTILSRAQSKHSTKDDLFWCFYIIHLGFCKYETIHNFFTEEKNVKIEFVELIRKHKDILKQNKWKRNHIENELVHEKKISLTTFICLCVITKHSFIVIDSRKILDRRIHSDIDNTYLIVKEGEEWILYTKDDKIKKIKNALETMWIIDSIKKPLRSIGSYKVKDLKDICQKLNIDCEKKRKKELYQTIMENL